MSPFDLRPEQEFSLAAIKLQVKSASRDELERMVVSVTELMMRKDNFLNHELKRLAGCQLSSLGQALDSAGILDDGDGEA